ncbi:unnamed protein product [Parascedosporium putredinis]|uniref:THIF-type NAD/FAD binding fold domain-containing protein n=1 Tax=Parascedosporium putredinis TaxID=1442378 RepID=A0A9P1GX28_9PEZI|nr:unnamed protein product [Parascedosporium putredinis]CAI7988656.1 unnamed protein product [Parascedosporium putredinis]
MEPTQSNGTTVISEDEIALYDRQIRLWGLQAQEKIRKASVLLITLRALGNEIAKNLVLAGISSLTILDPAPATPTDLGAQFFLNASRSEAAAATPSAPSEEQPQAGASPEANLDGSSQQDQANSDPITAGQNRASASAPAIQKLNPRVSVKVDPSDPSSKDDAFFSQFDVIIATDLPAPDLQRINAAARRAGKAFYAASLCGMYGFVFADLGEHEYVIQRDAGNVATRPGPETRTRAVLDVRTKKDGPRTVESVTKREIYSPLPTPASPAPSPRLRQEQAPPPRRHPVLSCLRALWSFVPASSDPPAAAAAAAGQDGASTHA